MFDFIDIKSLSEIDRSIIRYIVNNPELASLMRVRDLAEAVHVSASSVMRFLDHVNFDSFASLKVAIKNNLIDQQPINNVEALTNVNYSEQLNFDKDFESKIELLADRISEAKVTYLMGLGSSGIMADYASRLLSSIGYICSVSKDGDLPVLWNENIFDNSNVLLVFSTSGETEKILSVTENFKHRDRLFVVSITNNQHNTLAHKSDLNLPYYISKERLLFHVDLSSQIPVVFIIESLVKTLYERRILSKKTPL